MTVYRCDWCGRFYSSPLPEGSACANHVLEHNARLRASIDRHNVKIAIRLTGEQLRASAALEPGAAWRDALRGDPAPPDGDERAPQ